MQTPIQNRWARRGMVLSLLMLSLALLGWGVQVKSSMRLHADMTAHESAINLSDGVVIPVIAAELGRNFGPAPGEFLILLCCAGSLVLLQVSAAAKVLLDAVNEKYSGSENTVLQLHPFLFRPPPQISI
jgi:hypothetical protein